MNYFEIFSIKEEYAIDQDLLQSKYFDLLLKYHQDKTSLARIEFPKKSDSRNEPEQLKHIDHSMLINEAFEVLKDDYLRAKYLLKLKGKNFNDYELKNILSPDKLEKILESYELIESTKDLSELSKIEQEKTKKCYQLILELEKSFKENNLQEALDLTVILNYFTKMVKNIKLKIKNANN